MYTELNSMFIYKFIFISTFSCWKYFFLMECILIINVLIYEWICLDFNDLLSDTGLWYKIVNNFVVVHSRLYDV